MFKTLFLVVVLASVGCVSAEERDEIPPVDGQGGAIVVPGTGGALPAAGGQPGTGGAAGSMIVVPGTGGVVVPGTGGSNVNPGTGGSMVIPGTGGSNPGTGGAQVCVPNYGQGCTCGGRIQCDGTCGGGSVVPANYNQPCGTCGGYITCDGSCSSPEPAASKVYRTATILVPASNVAQPSQTIGGLCNPGYFRTTIKVAVTWPSAPPSASPPAIGNCTAFGSADTRSCAATVFITAGTVYATTCVVTISETGVCL